MSEKKRFEGKSKLDDKRRFQEEHKEFMAEWLARRQVYMGQSNEEDINHLSKEPKLEDPEQEAPLLHLEDAVQSEDTEAVDEDVLKTEVNGENIQDSAESNFNKMDDDSRPPLFQQLNENHWMEEEWGSEATEQLEQPATPKTSIFNTIPPLVWLKSFPVIILAMAVLVLSLYFVLPISKEKKISIEGVQALTVAEIEEFSQITADDYILTFWLFRNDYAQNIVNSSPLVKSAQIHYQFPNRFTISIEEYATIGYVKRNETYHSVLANGEILEQAYTGDALLSQFTTINLQNQDLIRKLATQLVELDSSLRTNIQAIDLTPSKVTSDLLTLTMYDGNKVLIPLTDIGEKLIYYPKIASQLAVASIVDMEVGIFSYPIARVVTTVTEEVGSDEIITENNE